MKESNEFEGNEELIAAIVAGEEQRVADLARTVGEEAGANPPALHAALNVLGYHDRLALINEVMAIAWPRVQEAAAYSSPAVQAYAGRATDHLLYAYLQETDEPDAHDPELQEKLEQYFPIDVARLAPYLSLLAGHVGRRWSREDFAELETQKLQGLMIEFLGHTHREGIPYACAHLVREHLPHYFLDRAAGNLYPKEDVGALLRSGRRPRPMVTEPEEPLLPDAPTLENFLQKLLRTVNAQPYVAAAILELLPAWLRFLASRSLISSQQQANAQQAVAEVRESVAPALASFADPALAHLGER